MPNEKISHLIESQVPDFITNDFPNFVSFIEAYYRWSELEGNPYDRLSSILAAENIDDEIIIEEFTNFFKKEYLLDIPWSVLSDTKLLVKNIKDFYASRGTEQSFKLLFRILFDVDVDFYYPKVDILKTSDGIWQRNISLCVNNITGDINDIVNRKIGGSISKAETIVSSISLIDSSTYKIISASKDLTGTFLVGDIISIVDKPTDVGAVSATVMKRLTNISILNPGSGYTTGSNIYIYPDGYSQGIIPHGTITKTNRGGLTHITILNGGSNYKINDVLIFNPVDGWGAYAYVDTTGETGNIVSVTIKENGYNYKTAPGVLGLDGTAGITYNTSGVRVYSSSGSSAIFETDSTTIGAISKIKIINPFLDYSPSTTYVNNIAGLNNSLCEDATIGLTFGAQYMEPETYLGTTGHLSSDKFLQDNWYYQDFSYLLRSSIQYSEFEEILKKILHPAGMLLISSIFDIPVEYTPDKSSIIAEANTNPVNYIIKTINNINFVITDNFKFKFIITTPDGFDTGNNEKFNPRYESFDRAMLSYSSPEDGSSNFEYLSDATINIATDFFDDATPNTVLGDYYDTTNNTSFIHRDETYVIWKNGTVYHLGTEYGGDVLFDNSSGLDGDYTANSGSSATGKFRLTTYTYEYDSSHDGSSGVYDDAHRAVNPIDSDPNDPSAGWTYRTYHNNFGDVQLVHIFNKTIGDFIDIPNKKTNICPEAIVSVYKYK